MCFQSSSFVTLTYKDNPVSLVPRDATLFLKRLRKRVGSFRYFLVGEYGDKFGRPHYHVALFGVCPLIYQQEIAQAWGQGFVHCGLLEQKSAAYIAGYVTKKMTDPDDARLDGRHPEFARMSLKPGIGAPALKFYAPGYFTKGGSQVLMEQGDVSAAVRVENRLFPLGRYLRSKLREEIGWHGNQPSIVREAKILARADRTPDQVSRDERVRLGGLNKARARERLANQLKVF